MYPIEKEEYFSMGLGIVLLFFFHTLFLMVILKLFSVLPTITYINYNYSAIVR